MTDVIGTLAHAMWTERRRLSVHIDHSYEEQDLARRAHPLARGRHAPTIHPMTASLAGGTRITFIHKWLFPESIVIGSPSGGVITITKANNPIASAWRAIQADACLSALNEPDALEIDAARPPGLARRITALLHARDRGFAGRMNRAPRVLAEAVARHIRQNGASFARFAHPEPNADDPPTLPSTWRQLPGDMLLLASDMRRSMSQPCIVSHPVMGALSIPPDGVNQALRDFAAGDIGESLTGRPRIPAAVPATGSARIQRIMRLCADALAADPGLADAGGARIAPLVEEHLPNLARAHAAAVLNAPTDDLARIDEEFERGIAIAARSVGEALEGSAARNRDALRVELRFLETRHAHLSGVGV